MSDRLQIDLAELDQLATDLARITEEFRSLDNGEEDLEGAVGQEVLAKAVSEFSDGWKKRRQKLLESLETTAQPAAVIHDTFVEVDDQLSDSITGKN